jgi:hypothetical protein
MTPRIWLDTAGRRRPTGACWTSSSATGYGGDHVRSARARIARELALVLDG